MARKSTYNPGRPTLAVQMPDGTFAIDSFRGEADAYRVNPAAGTCSCPHYVNRLAGTGQVCKHVDAVRLQEQYRRLEEKAQALTDQQLVSLLPKYETAGRLEIALAIRAELWGRGQQVAA